MSRIETGPVQIGDDWPGIFIRGDNALMGYWPAVDRASRGEASAMDMAVLASLARLLRSCAAPCPNAQIVPYDRQGGAQHSR